QILLRNACAQLQALHGGGGSPHRRGRNHERHAHPDVWTHLSCAALDEACLFLRLSAQVSLLRLADASTLTRSLCGSLAFVCRLSKRFLRLFTPFDSQSSLTGTHLAERFHNAQRTQR